MWRTQGYIYVDEDEEDTNIFSQMPLEGVTVTSPEEADERGSEQLQFPGGWVWAGTLENNCGVMFLQNLCFFGEAGMAFFDQKLYPHIESVAKQCHYGAIMIGLNDMQDEQRKIIEKHGFKLFHDFKSPRTGSHCYLYLKALT